MPRCWQLWNWLARNTSINAKEQLHRKNNIGDRSIIIFLKNNSQSCTAFCLRSLHSFFFARMGTGNLSIFGVSSTILHPVWFLIYSIISNNSDLLRWVLEIFHFLLLVPEIYLFPNNYGVWFLAFPADSAGVFIFNIFFYIFYSLSYDSYC